ncbi:1,4-alpha-glucan branching enzyme [Chitinophaga costaii]|uniref:1,4-alpha-glucan branching enzyme GlgB n=1 Tax=Chitinophaga costaii TaxID=1335309 RepID=A0A1C4CGM1_9BACT|nr:1,4-alpha-glucan branching protein GlgB [Chitinophaga costaii]PUZ27097.1 1,4-alpha-glucan branching protein GlgB [Chitinophaga costaii]SCC18232.1 1,4-alpha-glucan branching enzyme [Chitinophaga costaii]
MASKGKKSNSKQTSEPVSSGIIPFSRFTEFDIALFGEGRHYRLYEKFGAHTVTHEGLAGTSFAVWAPNAKSVSVVGDFNDWNPKSHVLLPRWDRSGIWEGMVAGVGLGVKYKYFILSTTGEQIYKGDPYANEWELRPKTASVTTTLEYKWKDKKWMKDRYKKNSLQSPMSVYEVHLGSWRRPDLNNHEVFYSYQEITEMLVPYVAGMGFTHVELMPIMEHPFDGSWGYQITGYFAPTSRYGSPIAFMAMVDAFHQAGVGVILDWVPSHFPYDEHGLYRFDGSYVYESEDLRKGYHPDWNSYIFNYARNEVKAFLTSNAVFWLDKFHIDGLRVDAVASVIHLNYSRPAGTWEPNVHGGPENLEAITFLQDMNTYIYDQFPDVQMIAEESTSFYGVSRPVFSGGLGFGQKWMMGWMNDTLRYFKTDPLYRKVLQDQFSFSIAYAFSENFMLPLSHDEVVHGKSSLLYKMPGDDWQKFANLRTMYTYMFTHPGTKLLFMGGEFGQTGEWDYKAELYWNLLQYAPHEGLQHYVKALNQLYTTHPGLYEKQFEFEGFEWVNIHDYDNSVIAYARHGKMEKDQLLIVLNMTPVPRLQYPLGLREEGTWEVVLNSDDNMYGGSGVGNTAPIKTEAAFYNGQPFKLTLDAPPLGALVLKKKK